MFGRSYQSLGSTSSDLLLLTKGLVKILIGGTFLDLIKDGKLVGSSGTSITSVDTLSNIGSSDGFYYVKDTGAIIVVYNGSLIPITSGASGLSYTLKQTLTAALKELAFHNLGLLATDKSDLNLSNGIVYYNQTLYGVNNNIISNLGIEYTVNTLSILYGANTIGQFSESGFTADNAVILNLKVKTLSFVDGDTSDIQYLSRVANDTAEGYIIFKKGLDSKYIYSNKTVSDYLYSNNIQSVDYGYLSSGFKLFSDYTGSSTLEADYIIARKKFTTNVLEINKIDAISGDKVFTCAGNELTDVLKIYVTIDSKTSYITTDTTRAAENLYYKCYLKANEDEDSITTNYWKVNDLAKCLEFSGGESSRYYWRKVAFVYNKGKEYTIDSTTTTEDKDFILISGSDYDKTSEDYPVIGDSIVQLGNTTDTNRLNAIALVVSSDGAPGIIEYAGINTYSLTGKMMTLIAPNIGNVFKGQSFQVIAGNNKDAWVSTTEYKINDRVIWNSVWYIAIATSITNADNTVTTNINLLPTDTDSKFWKLANYVDVDKSIQLYANKELLTVDYDSTNSYYSLNIDLDYSVINVLSTKTTTVSDLSSYKLVITSHSTSNPNETVCTIKASETSEFVYNPTISLLPNYYTNYDSSTRIDYIIVSLYDSNDTLLDSRTINAQINTKGILELNDREVKLMLGKAGIKIVDDKIQLIADKIQVANPDNTNDIFDMFVSTEVDKVVDGITKKVTVWTINALNIRVSDLLWAGTINANNATITNLITKDIIINGSIRSPFLYSISSFDTDYSDNVSLESEEDEFTIYSVPWDISQNGRRITITNYKYVDGTTEGISFGRITIGSEDGKYFFENGVASNSLSMSREAVELLGYGSSTTFFGWIVLRRIDLMPIHSYGREKKILMKAKVIGSPNGATITAETFDNSDVSKTVKITRKDRGKYTVSLPSTFNFGSVDNVYVSATGYGDLYDESNNPIDNPVKVSVRTISITNLINPTVSIEFWTSDDSSLNDGGFFFEVSNLSSW